MAKGLSTAGAAIASGAEPAQPPRGAELRLLGGELT
jgi:hypothetical protein